MDLRRFDVSVIEYIFQPYTLSFVKCASEKIERKNNPESWKTLPENKDEVSPLESFETLILNL